MRKLAVIIIALATLAFFAGVASAGMVSISGTHSKDEIKATCAREGASYSEDAGGYGCAKPCGGSSCGVGCTNDGQCTGHCPKCGQARVTARNFRVLTHGLWQNP
jgi:hypothetical protein